MSPKQMTSNIENLEHTQQQQGLQAEGTALVRRRGRPRNVEGATTTTGRQRKQYRSSMRKGRKGRQAGSANLTGGNQPQAIVVILPANRVGSELPGIVDQFTY